ncbi:hypothetical protein AOQ84DRAFT_386650 [Glonium stellatum]|uniref:Uncharacterized protein n=1 Tax=Glonium stellatum TaxID=574774 RepID=A0A8E2F773_9PEZI|nr:hypothetical protein AOQ84DRAFT_386650 [Glonium stellatum]
MESPDCTTMLDDKGFEFPFSLEYGDDFGLDVDTHKPDEQIFSDADLSLPNLPPESTLVDCSQPSGNHSEWTPYQERQSRWSKSTDENNETLAEFQLFMDQSFLGVHSIQPQTPALQQNWHSLNQAPVVSGHGDSWDTAMGQHGFKPCQPDFISHFVTDSSDLAIRGIKGYHSEDIPAGGDSGDLRRQPEGGLGENDQVERFISTDMETWLDKHLVTFGTQQLAGPVKTTAISDAPKYTEVLKAPEQRLENSAPSSTPYHTQALNKRTNQQKFKTQRSRISPEARSILEEHFNNDAYPTARDIDVIAQLSNLENKTVKNWFNNTRSRRSVRELNNTVQSFPGPQLSSSRKSKKDVDVVSVGSKSSSNLSIERYLEAPLDEEPASAKAIEAALTLEPHLQSYSHSGNVLNELPQQLGDSCSSILISSSGRPLSDDGVMSNRHISAISSRHSSASGGSPSSHGSSTSSFGRARRRGRKRWHHTPYSTSSKGLDQKEEDEDDQGRNVSFFCTFCRKAFMAKYEWKRHEEAVHLPQKTWICCYQGAPSPTRCPFCWVFLPTEEHLAKHRYQECMSKPEAQRTFSRKDHLFQHIRNTHNTHDLSEHPPIFPIDATLKSWECSPPPLESDNPALHCGFCGRWFRTWNERSEHIARHFKSGVEISTWWPGRIYNDDELENVSLPFYSNSPHMCRYCHEQFPDLVTAQRRHPCCKLFSCSFLPDPESIFAFGAMPHEKYCRLCDFEIDCSHENAGHLIQKHAKAHKYRKCDQRIYYSFGSFWDHLGWFHFHGGSPCLRGEQVVSSWTQVKPAVFEPVDPAMSAIAKHSQCTYGNSTIPQRYRNAPHQTISDLSPKEPTEEIWVKKPADHLRTFDSFQGPENISKASPFSDLDHPGRKSPLPKDASFRVNKGRSIMAQPTRRTIGASN